MAEVKESRQVRRAKLRYRAPLGLRMFGTTEAPVLTRAERRARWAALRSARPKLTHREKRLAARAAVALDVRFYPAFQSGGREG